MQNLLNKSLEKKISKTKKTLFTEDKIFLAGIGTKIKNVYVKKKFVIKKKFFERRIEFT